MNFGIYYNSDSETMILSLSNSVYRYFVKMAVLFIHPLFIRNLLSMCCSNPNGDKSK